jgi:RNA exonuclease 1
MIQEVLVKIIDSDTILVGHSLECDLQALKLAHPHIIDTSVIYQHSRGPPYKPSLKWLAHKWLRRKIQDNPEGHDSAEDAATCVDLVKLKCQEGKDFGMFNLDMESIFARLKRRGIDSAVVEYGNRGGSFYGDKVRSCISAESDTEVADGIIEALNTDHRFVWSRMKEVETAAGWKDNDSSEQSADDIADTLAGFDSNIQRVWDGLSPCTALMVISGSGDPRQMSRLYSKRRAYDEELRTKPNGDIQVRWMGADQEAFTMDIDKARTGVGFVAIK